MTLPRFPLPNLVVAADWSTSEKKRWMVRALEESGAYVVNAPEPVGDPNSLLSRLRKSTLEGESVFVGFDFPIGLPSAYAKLAGISEFQSALRDFGHGKWREFYGVTDEPTLARPFFPPPTQQKSHYSRDQLARALGCDSLSAMLRRCDRRTPARRAAQCLFFTIGGAQVGRAAISGWRDVIQPALPSVHLWPFDGDLEALLSKPGVTVAEIYPTEAYTHLGVRIGAGTGRKKTDCDDRKEATKHLPDQLATGLIRLSSGARSAIEKGFDSDDDFDAMMGVLSMLQVVTGQRTARVPDVEDVRKIEGWILGQPFADEPPA